MKNGVKIGAPVMEITKDLLLFTWKGNCVYQSWLVLVKHGVTPNTDQKWIPRFFPMKNPGFSGTESVVSIIKILAKDKPKHLLDDKLMQISIGPTSIDPKVGMVEIARVPNFEEESLKSFGVISYKNALFNDKDSEDRNKESTAPTNDVDNKIQENKNKKLSGGDTPTENKEKEKVMENENKKTPTCLFEGNGLKIINLPENTTGVSLRLIVADKNPIGNTYAVTAKADGLDTAANTLMVTDLMKHLSIPPGLDQSVPYVLRVTTQCGGVNGKPTDVTINSATLALLIGTQPISNPVLPEYVLIPAGEDGNKPPTQPASTPKSEPVKKTANEELMDEIIARLKHILKDIDDGNIDQSNLNKMRTAVHEINDDIKQLPQSLDKQEVLLRINNTRTAITKEYVRVNLKMIEDLLKELDCTDGTPGCALKIELSEISSGIKNAGLDKKLIDGLMTQSKNLLSKVRNHIKDTNESEQKKAQQQKDLDEKNRIDAENAAKQKALDAENAKLKADIKKLLDEKDTLIAQISRDQAAAQTARTPPVITLRTRASGLASKLNRGRKSFCKRNGISRLAVLLFILAGVLMTPLLLQRNNVEGDQSAPSLFKQAGIKDTSATNTSRYKGWSTEPGRYGNPDKVSATAITPTNAPVISLVLSNVGNNSSNIVINNYLGTVNRNENSPGASISNDNSVRNKYTCANNPSHVHKTAKECTDKPANLPDNARRHPDGGWAWEYTLTPSEVYMYDVNPEWIFRYQSFNVSLEDVNVEYLKKDGNWETSDLKKDITHPGNNAYRFSLKPTAQENIKLFFRIY